MENPASEIEMSGNEKSDDMSQRQDHLAEMNMERLKLIRLSMSRATSEMRRLKMKIRRLTSGDENYDA